MRICKILDQRRKEFKNVECPYNKTTNKLCLQCLKAQRYILIRMHRQINYQIRKLSKKELKGEG